ncbi:hypothetical protein KM043_005962 [Ampulex compressa]|nr:hypothetical protein KM043_005962 [Ampulex compressa]
MIILPTALSLASGRARRGGSWANGSKTVTRRIPVKPANRGPRDGPYLLYTVTWEYPFPKSKEYWEKFLEEAEKKLMKVRNPPSKVSYPPLTIDYPAAPKVLSAETASRYSFSTELRVDKYKPRAVSVHKIPSSKSQSRAAGIKFPTKPAIRKERSVVPKGSTDFLANLNSTNFPLESRTINHGNTLNTPRLIKGETASRRSNGQSLDKISTRKIHRRSTCPFHKNEPSIRIFDDDIERYLMDVPREPTRRDKFRSSENSERTYFSSGRAKDGKIRTPKLLISEQDSKSASKAGTPSPVGNAGYSLASASVKKREKPNDADRQGETVKATQIPKLKAASLEPSFARITSGNTNENRAASDDPNALEAYKINDIIDEKSPESELAKLPTTPVIQLTPKQTSLEKTASHDSEMPLSDQCIDAEKSTLSGDNQTRKEIEEKPRTRRSPRYSIRCAYRALKFLTANKKLCFEPGIIKEKSEESSRQSVDDLSGDDIDESPSPRAQTRVEDKLEALCLREIQEKLKRSRDKNVDLKDLEPKYTESRTIFTTSRSTSGTSPKFADPKSRNDSSASFLANIPKLSYPRKVRDRCLSCMYSSFAKTLKQTSAPVPRTILQNTIFLESMKDEAAPYLESSSSDASTLDPSIEPKKPSRNVEAKIVDNFLREDEAISTDLKNTAAHTSQSVTRQKTVKLVKVVDQKCSAGPSSRIQLEKERITALDSSSKIPANLRTTSTSLSVDKPKICSSLDAQSSEDDDSPIFTLNDDASRTKRIAPCHMPTILKPSLEPLRALRLRKPTSIQSRIAANEARSMKKATSIDDYYDDDQEDAGRRPGEARKSAKPSEIIVEKSPVSRVEVPEENKEGKKEEGKNVPSSRGLTKARSVLDKLALVISKSDSKKEQAVLRKGLSFSSFTTRDLTSESSSLLDSQKLRPTTEISDLVRTEPFPKFADFPLVSADEITATLESFVERDAPSTQMLEALCEEFVARLSKGNADLNSSRRSKIATRLTRLLVDSRPYLRPEKFPSDRVFSSKQPPLYNSRQLRRILPLDSYNLVAPLLGMPKWYPRRPSFVDSIDLKRHRVSRKRSSEELSFDLMVHPPSPRDVASSEDEEGIGRPRLNPYALFLKKPRRKVVTWRPLTAEDLKGYDPEATLNMRARNITEKICREFCRWLKDLGGTDKVIDEEVLRDMFEIDFTAEACRAMEISINEMPMVPTEVALTRNCPGASMLAMTKKHLIGDAKAERKRAKVRAFGTCMPPELSFVPPKNQVRKNWLQCEHVPRDLETMEAVWKGITQLDSVKGFVRWLREHPEVSPPEALKTIASVDIGDTPHAQEDETSAHLELDLDQIHSLKVADNDPGRTT